MCSCILNEEGAVWIFGVLHSPLQMPVSLHWYMASQTMPKNIRWYEPSPRRHWGVSDYCHRLLQKGCMGKVGGKKTPGQILFCMIISSLWNTAVWLFYYCANIWRGTILCMQNLSHMNSVENNFRIFFFLLAFSSVYVWNSEEHKDFISMVHGLYYLIAICVITEKNNSILAR